jgi:hypothetical protein
MTLRTRALVLVAAATLLAALAACTSSPSSAERHRADTIAADPIFTANIDRPGGDELTYDYGKNALWDSKSVVVIRKWESHTYDYAAVAELAQIAADNGWVGLTAECDEEGAVVTGEKVLDDGEPFNAGMTIRGPSPDSLNIENRDTLGLAASGRSPQRDEQRPLVEPDRPAIVDLSCLDSAPPVATASTPSTRSTAPASAPATTSTTKP